MLLLINSIFYGIKQNGMSIIPFYGMSECFPWKLCDKGALWFDWALAKLILIKLIIDMQIFPRLSDWCIMWSSAGNFQARFKFVFYFFRIIKGTVWFILWSYLCSALFVYMGMDGIYVAIYTLCGWKQVRSSRMNSWFECWWTEMAVLFPNWYKNCIFI